MTRTEKRSRMARRFNSFGRQIQRLEEEKDYIGKCLDYYAEEEARKRWIRYLNTHSLSDLYKASNFGTKNYEVAPGFECTYEFVA